MSILPRAINWLRITDGLHAGDPRLERVANVLPARPYVFSFALEPGTYQPSGLITDATRDEWQLRDRHATIKTPSPSENS